MCFCVCLAVCAGRTRAADVLDTRPINVYPLYETKEKVVLDGKADEQAWKQAPLAGDFVYLNRRGPVPAQTYLRFLCDAEWLYVYVEAEEPLV